MKEVGLYIPCFNAATTIGHCLDAVYRQTYPIKETLIVDDASTDGTADVASRYPVRIVRHKENRGLAAARNTAVKNINAEFIASLDADCLPEHDWLARLIKCCSSSHIAGAGGRLLEMPFSVFDIWRTVHMKQHWGAFKNNPDFLFGANTVFRKDALIKAGLYKEKLRNNYEDVDMCRRLKETKQVLVYEPKASVRHYKKDDIYSVLNTYWKWHAAYYNERRYYCSEKRFVFKIKDNLGLANRYIEEDMASKKYELVYLDFILGLHHSLKDLDFFISQREKNPPGEAYTPLLSWLALLDLTFFYHLYPKTNMPTLIKKNNRFLQNFLAMDLVLGRLMKRIFPEKDFLRKLYGDLFLSVYKHNNTYLLESMLNLVDFHPEWSGLFIQKQPNINRRFLEALASSLEKWLEGLAYRLPEAIQMIIISAEKT